MKRLAAVGVSRAIVVIAVAALATLGSATTAIAASAPLIENEAVSNVTQADATLEADINPGGLATHYQFRLAYGCGFPGEACPMFCIAGQPCPGPGNSIITVPLPSGDLPASIEVQHVTLDLNSVGVTLEPYKYRYSIEATNAEGTAQGADQYFEPVSSPPPPSNSPPSVESESVSHITPTDATVEAKINPGGLETEFQFRVLASPCHAIPVNCELVSDPLFPSPPGKVAAGPGSQTVKLDLNSAGLTLEPGQEYHYAVFVANFAGKEGGPDRTFTTPSAPSIESESVSHVSATDATLEAEINTEGLGTTYTFYIAEEGPACLKAEPPCMMPQKAPVALPSGELLGSFIGQNVSGDLNSAGVSLSPGVSYEYWVTATNAVGTTEGQPQSFTALSEGGAEPLNEPSGSTAPQAQAVSPPSSAQATHRRHHRRHRGHRARYRGNRIELHRAKAAR